MSENRVDYIVEMSKQHLPCLCQILICLNKYSEAPAQGLLPHQNQVIVSAPDLIHIVGHLLDFLKIKQHKHLFILS